MYAFGDQEATAILNEVIKNVLARKGVESGSSFGWRGNFLEVHESLRAPDWLLVYYKTKARSSGHTWQAVINITKLGMSGVTARACKQ